MLKRKYKVKKAISGTAKAFRKWEEYATGDVIIGKYVDIHTDQYKKTCWIIDVEEAHFKKSKEDYAGKHLVLNNCGSLAKAMEKVSVGDLLQIEYTGMTTIEKGPYAGKDAHTVKVDVIELEDEGSDSDDL